MILIRPPQINIKIPPHVNLIPANIFQRKYKTVRIVTTIPLFIAIRNKIFLQIEVYYLIFLTLLLFCNIDHRLFFHIPLIFTKMLYIINNNFRLCPWPSTTIKPLYILKVWYPKSIFLLVEKNVFNFWKQKTFTDRFYSLNYNSISNNFYYNPVQVYNIDHQRQTLHRHCVQLFLQILLFEPVYHQ